MLKFFRRRDTVVRWLLGGFLVVICFSMVLYLIPGINGAAGATALTDQQIATVNGTPISGQDLGDELARVERGQQIPAQLAPMFGRQVLKNMVVERALTDQAKSLGLTVSDQEVADAAKNQDPELYPGGKYVGDDVASQAVAQNFQMTLDQFQDRIREDVLAGKVYNLVTDPVRVSDAEVKAEFLKENEKAKLDYVFIKPADVEKDVQVTPAALQAYFQQHQANYMSPERRKLEVVLADQTAIGAAIPVSDVQVEQYYNQNKANYTHPERVKAAHILIKFPGAAGATPTPAEIAATRKTAEDVLKQVKAPGADFAALAKKYSQDPGSAVQGGELGYLVHGQTVPNFDKAVFSMPVGQISDLIQTEYGFHIIKVEAHEPARLQPLSEVHDQIVQTLQKAQGADKAQNLINRAQAMAAKTPLAQVAQQLNLQYFTTDALGRNDPVTGIGVNPDFANAAFSAALNTTTMPVAVAQGFAIAKVDQIVPPGPQTFDAVKDTVTGDYKQDEAKQLVKTKAAELDQAAQKQGLKAAAASLHFTVKTSDPVERGGSLPDAGAISSFADTLFALKPGQVGPVAATGDNAIVYALDALTEPTDAEFAAQSNTVLNTLLQQKRSSVFQAYTDALVDRLTKAKKIEINEDAFQRAVGGTGQPAPAGGPLGF